MFLGVRNFYFGGLGNVRRCQNSLVCTDNSEYLRSSIKYEYTRSKVTVPRDRNFSDMMRLQNVRRCQKFLVCTYIPLLAIDPVRINKKIFDRNEHERIL